MTLCVYAITDHPGRLLPAQSGLNDAPLAQRVYRDIAAVVSAYGGAHPSASADDLWRYEDVLESLMCDRTVLPVRFATTAPSWRHVGDMLCAAYSAFVHDIERVRGQVEIGMRFLTASEHGGEGEMAPAASGRLALPGTGPGAAYLSVKIARERQLRHRRRAKLKLVREVYERLASHANASRLDDEPDDRQATSAAAAFLVPRDGIVSFQEIVGEVANAHPQLALICTGPWPPYSFVTAGEMATR